MFSHRTTQQQLAQLIDDSLSLLKQAAIPEAPHEGLQGQLSEPVGSLLDQCIALCAQHQAVTQEPIRLIYHFGLPENSSLIASLATLANTKVMLDVYPGSDNFEHQLKKQTIVPIAIKGYETGQASSLEKAQWAQWFLNDLQQRHRQTQQIGQRLLLVNNYCLPEQSQQDTQADLLALMAGRFEVWAIIVVADPAESYKTYCALAGNNQPSLDFEGYCKRLSTFVSAHSELATFNYEDYLADPSKTLLEICEQLALPFNAESENLKRVFISDIGQNDITLEKPKLPKKSSDVHIENKIEHEQSEFSPKQLKVDDLANDFYPTAISVKFKRELKQLNDQRDKIFQSMEQEQKKSNDDTIQFEDCQLPQELEDELVRAEAQIELIKELLLCRNLNPK